MFVFNIMNQKYKCVDECDFKTNKLRSLTGHKRQCKKYKLWKNKFIKNNEDQIIDLYVNQKKSLADLADILQPKHANGIGLFASFLKEKNLRRTIKESTILEGKKLKAKKTNLEKYGSEHNFCRTHPSRKKWEKSLFENEGIVNVFQRKEVKEQIYKTYIRKYGVVNPGSLPRKGRENFSSIHKWTFELLNYYLDTSKVFLEKKFLKEDSKTYFSYDLWIENTNLLIEVNGDYWHANPCLYQENDYILYGSNKNKIAKEIWEKDLTKIDFAKSKGYEVYVIWEQDIKTASEATAKKLLEWISNKNEDCKNQINQKINPWSKVRYFRRWK
ncbi:MAG TPA: hypothetical protein PLP33_19570 [Leptospiraceae bacterium]|nr:hypothetical protein [Leptospiraceae bacterium]